jgi:hypothetical protein
MDMDSDRDRPKHVAYDVDLGPIVLVSGMFKSISSALVTFIVDGLVPYELHPGDREPTHRPANPTKVCQQPDQRQVVSDTQIPVQGQTTLTARRFANYSDTLTNPSKLKTADISNFSFQTGKTHLLRFVNGAAEGFQHVSIDNHLMTVVAVDFTPIEPYNTTVVTLGAGQRTEVLVRATGASTDSYWLRANMSATCSLVEQPYGLAAIHYPRAKRASLPHSTAHPYADTGSCLNDPLNTTVPLLASAPATPDPTTLTIDVQLALNASGAQHYYMNNVTFVGNLSAPILGVRRRLLLLPPLLLRSSSSFPAGVERAGLWPQQGRAPGPHQQRDLSAPTAPARARLLGDGRGQGRVGRHERGEPPQPYQEGHAHAGRRQPRGSGVRGAAVRGG